MNKGISRIIDNVIDTIIDISHHVVNGSKKVANWINENPQAAASAVSTGILLLKASRSLVVSHRVYSERKRIDRTYYDPKTGYHWDLRRKLNNNDRNILTRRKNAGDDVYDILRDLKAI